MDKFIRRENLAPFTRRLADPTLTEAQRKVLLTPFTQEQVKGRQEHSLDPCQSKAGRKPSLLAGADHSWMNHVDSDNF
jgi:hypothetical protein